MISPAELSLQRRLSVAFIAADAVDVVVLRAGTVPTDAGGTRQGAPVALTAQTVRLLPGAGREGSAASQATLVDGQNLTNNVIVLGPWNLDIQPEDTFVHEGRTYQIKTVVRPGNYETKAEAVSRG